MCALYLAVVFACHVLYTFLDRLILFNNNVHFYYFLFQIDKLLKGRLDSYKSAAVQEIRYVLALDMCTVAIFNQVIGIYKNSTFNATC